MERDLHHVSFCRKIIHAQTVASDDGESDGPCIQHIVCSRLKICRAGDQVIAVFEEYAIRYNYDNATIRSHSNEIITQMANKIIELDAKGIRVSRHCVNEATYRAHNIMDVSRSGYDSSNIPIFTAAAKRMGCTVVRDEPANGCLHLEF